MAAADSELEIMAWARSSLPSTYSSVLQSVIESATRDKDITAVLLTGSIARRDGLPGTDIDLREFRSSAGSDSFAASRERHVLIEKIVTNEEEAHLKLLSNPMQVYVYLDGVALYDPVHVLHRLRGTAEEVFAAYRSPAAQKVALAAALAHPEEKARVAQDAGDMLKATYSLATCSWQIIEGLWAANDLPLPPNASVRPHLRDLRGPVDVERLFSDFFLGDTATRVETGLQLMSWIRTEVLRV